MRLARPSQLLRQLGEEADEFVSLQITSIGSPSLMRHRIFASICDGCVTATSVNRLHTLSLYPFWSTRPPAFCPAHCREIAPQEGNDIVGAMC